MKRALLVRRYGALTSSLRNKLFPGWDVYAYGGQPTGKQYDAVVCAFEENTQREIEWVEAFRDMNLRTGGKFIRTS